MGRGHCWEISCWNKLACMVTLSRQGWQKNQEMRTEIWLTSLCQQDAGIGICEQKSGNRKSDWIKSKMLTWVIWWVCTPRKWNPASLSDNCGGKRKSPSSIHTEWKASKTCTVRQTAEGTSGPWYAWVILIYNEKIMRSLFQQLSVHTVLRHNKQNPTNHPTA